MSTNGTTHGGPPDGFYDDQRPEAGETTPATMSWGDHVVPAPAAWFEKAPGPRAWLLRDARRATADGLLPLGKVGQLIAEGGAGKTMLACQLALAVATGERWLGWFDVAARGRVLLALGEEDTEEIHRRLFRARAAGRTAIPPEGSIVTLPLAGVPAAMLEKDDRGNLCETAFLRWLRTWMKVNGPWSLVIVDPLSRFAGPDAEIDNAAATRFIQALESIASETGATVLVAHHTTKASRNGQQVVGASGRGASALFDGARWQCSLGIEKIDTGGPADEQERLGEIAVLTFTKSNYSRRAEPLLLRRDGTNGGALLPLDELDAEMVEKVRSGESAAEARAARKESERQKKITQDAVALVVHVRECPGDTVRSIRMVLFGDNSKRWAAVAHLLKRGVVVDTKGGITVDVERLPPEIRALMVAVEAKKTPRPPTPSDSTSR